MAGMLASDGKQAKLNSKKTFRHPVAQVRVATLMERCFLDGKVFPNKNISCNRGSKKNKKERRSTIVSLKSEQRPQKIHKSFQYCY